MIKNKISPLKVSKSPLEQEILSVVEPVLKESQLQLTKKDIQNIVQTLIPDLDEMISNKVKNHFVEIGEFLLKKFKTEE